MRSLQKTTLHASLMLVLAVSALLLSACTINHTQQTVGEWRRALGASPSTQYTRQYQWVLPTHSHIGLQPTRAGSSSTVAYHRLSMLIDETLQTRLAARFASVQTVHADAVNSEPDVIVAVTLLSVVDELSSVQELHSDYGIRSRHAKNRSQKTHATAPARHEISSIGQDRLALHVAVIDARSNNQLDKFVFQSQSGWYQYYRHTPHDLVSLWVDEFVSSISDF